MCCTDFAAIGRQVLRTVDAAMLTQLPDGALTPAALHITCAIPMQCVIPYAVYTCIVFAGPGKLELPKQPAHAWVTPIGQQSCLDACRSIGPGWRIANGGQPCTSWEGFCNLALTDAMCAGLLDMPRLGKQWLVGSIDGGRDAAACEIRCPTSPCWNLPPGASYTGDFVMAGRNNTYTAADGLLKYWDEPVPMKCACVKCNDSDSACQNTLWVETSKAFICPRPVIQPQAGETFPSFVYGGICRIDDDPPGQAIRGSTGWLDTQAAVCRSAVPKTGPGWSPGWPVKPGDWRNYSVWCPVV
jgi:hypothetical protein